MKILNGRFYNKKDFWYADFAFMNIYFLKSWDLFSAFLLLEMKEGGGIHENYKN